MSQGFLTNKSSCYRFLFDQKIKRPSLNILLAAIINELSQFICSRLAPQRKVTGLKLKLTAIQFRASVYWSVSPIICKVSIASMIVAPELPDPNIPAEWPLFETGLTSLAPQP